MDIRTPATCRRKNYLTSPAFILLLVFLFVLTESGSLACSCSIMKSSGVIKQDIFKKPELSAAVYLFFSTLY